MCTKMVQKLQVLGKQIFRGSALQVNSGAGIQSWLRLESWSLSRRQDLRQKVDPVTVLGCVIKTKKIRVGETAWQLRALVLLEDLSSISSTSVRWLTTASNSRFREYNDFNHMWT